MALPPGAAATALRSVWSETVRNEDLRALVQRTYEQAVHSLTRLLERWIEAGWVSATVQPREAGGPLLSMFLGYIVQGVVLKSVDAAAYARGMAQVVGAPGLE
jgi:hypothetical protein